MNSSSRPTPPAIESKCRRVHSDRGPRNCEFGIGPSCLGGPEVVRVACCTAAAAAGLKTCRASTSSGVPNKANGSRPQAASPSRLAGNSRTVAGGVAPLDDRGISIPELRQLHPGRDLGSRSLNMETTPFTARMVAYKSTTDNPRARGRAFDSQTDRGSRLSLSTARPREKPAFERSLQSMLQRSFYRMWAHDHTTSNTKSYTGWH